MESIKRENGVDREVHATAGRKASATSSYQQVSLWLAHNAFEERRLEQRVKLSIAGGKVNGQFSAFGAD